MDLPTLYKASTLVVLASLIPVSPLTAIESSIPNSENTDKKEYINHYRTLVIQLLHEWLNIMDNTSTSINSLDEFFNADIFDLKLVKGKFTTVSQFKNWIISRRKLLRSSHHRIANIDTRQVDTDIFSLKFQFELDEQPVNGPPERSFIEATWLIQITAKGKPIIVEVSEQYLPPKTHSGSRIQC